MAPRKLDDPYNRDERYRSIVHSPELAELAWRLLGGAEQPTVHSSQLFMKAPKVCLSGVSHYLSGVFLCLSLPFPCHCLS